MVFLLSVASVFGGYRVAPDEPLLAQTIAPPSFDGKSMEFNLPAAFDEVCVGGGGRYLILHLSSLKKLAVFDLSKGDIAGYVPAEDERIVYTAGVDTLVLVKTSSRTVEKYDLATQKRLATRKHSGDQPIGLVAMGSTSRGPVLVVLERQEIPTGIRPAMAELLDLETLDKLDVKMPQGHQFGFQAPNVVYASANGRVFGCHRRGAPQFFTLEFHGNELKLHASHTGSMFVQPDDTGERVYTTKGVYTSELRLLQQPRANRLRVLPATSGPFCMRVRQPVSGKGSLVEICLTVESEPLIQMGDVEVPESVNHPGVPYVGIAKRIFFVPEAQLLVTLPNSNDTVVLRRLVLEEELKASGKHYLATVSQPTMARLGQSFEYKIEVLSSAGGVTFHLDDGPEGMTLSEDGWSVGRRKPARSGAQPVSWLGSRIKRASQSLIRLACVSNAAQTRPVWQGLWPATPQLAQKSRPIFKRSSGKSPRCLSVRAEDPCCSCRASD